MKIKSIVLASAAAVAVLPAGALAQQGSDKTAKATFKSKIVVQKSAHLAKLKATYSCADGQVLWLSAKEVASGKKDARLKKEGSSKVSSGWWQSHRNKITCDGQSHTATFTIDKKEKGSKGTLKKGFAWVQFCITKGEDLTFSKSAFVAVK